MGCQTAESVPSLHAAAGPDIDTRKRATQGRRPLNVARRAMRPGHQKHGDPRRCGRNSGIICARLQGRTHSARQAPDWLVRPPVLRRRPKRRSARTGNTARGRGHPGIDTHTNTSGSERRRSRPRGPLRLEVHDRAQLPQRPKALHAARRAGLRAESHIPACPARCASSRIMLVPPSCAAPACDDIALNWWKSFLI